LFDQEGEKMREKKRTKRKELQDINKPKSRYQMIIDGEAEPEGSENGWKNLEAGRVSFNQMPEEKALEIRRKGAAAVNKMHGEKKTARESLEKILTLRATPEIIAGADLEPEIAERLKRDNPDATLYDLIQIVAVGRAVGGNMKAYELIRDTYGDKPTEKVEVSAEIMTDKDRELLEKISRRLDDPDVVVVADQTD